MPSDGAVHRRVEELITVGILEVHEGTGAADLARDPFPELDPRLPEGGDILVRGIHLPPFTSTRHHRGHGVKVTTVFARCLFQLGKWTTTDKGHLVSLPDV